MENSLPFYVNVDESDSYLFTVKNLPATQEPLVRSLSQEGLVVKEMATHSGILPGKSHRQRSLAGYSPCNRKELDTTE